MVQKSNSTDRTDTTRRSVLKGVAGAAGILAGAGPVTAKGTIENQYLVDTRSADSTAWRKNVKIVDEAPEVGAASVKADPSDLEGLRYAQEIEYTVEPPKTPDKAEPKSGSIDPQSHSSPGTGDATPPHPLQWDKEAQQVKKLHDQGITGEDTRIAIVDAGLDADHPDLNVNTTLSENFSAANSIGVPQGNYHGTHVGGIAAATGDAYDPDNPADPYVVGVAPDAELLDMKVFPYLSGASFIRAILTGAARADVVNMSFGPGSPYGPSVASDLNVDLYNRTRKQAIAMDAVLVESAGNADANIDATEETSTNFGKGSHRGVLRVSATGPISDASSLPPFGEISPYHTPAYYTSYGPHSVDVSASGGNVLSTLFDGVLSTMPPENPGGFARVGSGKYGAYGTLHGTSMAAPNVAGLAALVKSQNPDADPEQIKQHIKNTARDIDTQYPDIFQLFGFELEYFGNNSPGIFSDFQLEDPYSSQTYRGDGHIEVNRAATKSIPFPGGIKVNGRTVYPTDPDDDGLYEDVNGDGKVDMKDAELLYQMALRNAVGPRTPAFDFNGDGQFDIRDVQALIDMMD